MMCGSHYFIGQSARTNKEGGDQMIAHLEKYGMTGSLVTLKEVLHLKTGLSYIENNNLLATGEFLDSKQHP
jgi:dimethylargininase